MHLRLQRVNDSSKGKPSMRVKQKSSLSRNNPAMLVIEIISMRRQQSP
jgi:hypothetical protein